MKKILAIGGAAIKTDLDDLKKLVRKKQIEMLIHNGGSIFHDFQIPIDKRLQKTGETSYPLDMLMRDYSCNEEASNIIADWLKDRAKAPYGSLTSLCERRGIDVLMFTTLGADFWQMFMDDWSVIGISAKTNFDLLCNRFGRPFHYILMGSAVVHPEVFIKAIAYAKPKDFQADVVDFLDMYRPKTRVAKYGQYYQMSHKEFTQKWLEEIKQ